jgi:DNA-binding CsgD family transcriptional regulator
MRFTLESVAESLDSSSDPAFAVDGEAKIIAWNSAAETELGLPRGHALGEPCHEVICGQDVFGHLVCQNECLVFRSIRERKPVRRFRMYVRVSGGHYVEAECATLCVRDSSKEKVIIHLLRLWPGRAQGYVSDEGRGDARASRRPLQSLTPRETEVLGLLAAGKSTGDMVNDLGVSPATVRSHVENILRKLEVHSRLEAVVVAMREELV